jgi:hypothetical protein
VLKSVASRPVIVCDTSTVTLPIGVGRYVGLGVGSLIPYNYVGSEDGTGVG